MKRADVTSATVVSAVLLIINHVFSHSYIEFSGKLRLPQFEKIALNCDLN